MECPNCKGFIGLSDRTCRKCGYSLVNTPKPVDKPSPLAPQCVHCGTTNQQGTRVCSYCGKDPATLSLCATCGNLLPAQVKFCPGCGNATYLETKPPTLSVVCGKFTYCEICGKKDPCPDHSHLPQQGAVASAMKRSASEAPPSTSKAEVLHVGGNDSRDRLADRVEPSAATEMEKVFSSLGFRLQITENEVRQMFELIRHSNYIQTKELLKPHAQDTQFVFLDPRTVVVEERDEELRAKIISQMWQVNAWAWRSELMAKDERWRDIVSRIPSFNEKKFVISIYGGMSNAVLLLGLCIAAQPNGFRGADFKDSYFATTFGLLTAVMIKNQGRVTDRDCALIFTASNLFAVMKAGTLDLRRAKSYSSAILAAVLAHEFGHICMGHIAPGMGDEVNRNTERQADFFADAVVATSPFNEYALEGQLLYHLLFTWKDSLTGMDANGNTGRTHPLSRERLFDHLRNNAEQYARLGIEESTLSVLLPETR